MKKAPKNIVMLYAHSLNRCDMKKPIWLTRLIVEVQMNALQLFGFYMAGVVGSIYYNQTKNISGFLSHIVGLLFLLGRYVGSSAWRKQNSQVLRTWPRLHFGGN